MLQIRLPAENAHAGQPDVTSHVRISIITATFNSASVLPDCLASVASQAHPDVEHIVIDGASTDETLEVLAAHRSTLASVVSERDGGIYDAMNKGIARATGEVIGLLNSDDFYVGPDVLTRVAAAFAAEPIDVCYGDLCYVDRVQTNRVVRYWKSNPFRPGDFSRGWCPPHPTLFVRRSVYERFGGFDLQYRTAADIEFMARLLEVHRLPSRYLPGVMVHMRLGGTTNKSLRNVVYNNQEMLRALRAHGLLTGSGRYFLYKAISRTKQFLHQPPSLGGRVAP